MICSKRPLSRDAKLLLPDTKSHWEYFYQGMDQKEKRKVVENPRQSANIFSALTISWIVPIFWLGFRRDLEEEDLYDTLKEHTSNVVGEKAVAFWEEELKTIKAEEEISEKKEIEKKSYNLKKVTPSLLRVLVKCFGFRFLMYGIIMAILQILTGVSQPLLLGLLLRSFGSGDTMGTYMYLCATGVVLCSFVKALALTPYNLAAQHIGMKMRVTCCTLIYRKALKLSKTALGETTVGQAVNLLSNDVNRFDTAIVFLNYLWIGPLQTIITAYFMYAEAGVAGLCGIATLLLFLPLQGYLGKRSVVLRSRTAIRTDERVRLTNEIITGIQAIKMYTWEKAFGDLVQAARKREINTITATSYLRAVILSFLVFVPRFNIFISILAYVLLGNDITAEKVFMLTAYYNILREAMAVYFPQALSQGGEMLVSIGRLQTFLLYEESEATKLNQSNDEADKSGKSGSLEIVNGSAKWLASAKNDTLRGVNLNVKPGQLIAIVGQVGSGKSSLLNIILREMPLNAGTIEVNGRLSYASQEPWLFAGSVRQNILFGREMDSRKYERVVKVCQLKRDFTLFPYGDKTIVGDRGISLSGGQRARVNLARAVYASADIYLMDDPLSAVDAHVGKSMFEECIAGYLEGKTRILVTHQLQYLKNVDCIVVLKDGAVLAQGTYQELQRSGVDFGQLLETPEEKNQDTKPIMKHQISRGMSNRSSIRSEKSNDEEQEDAPKQEAEARTSGIVTGQVYATYIRAGGNWCIAAIILALLLISQIIGTSSDLFISYWVGLTEWDSWLSQDLCMYIYSGLIIANGILALVRSAAFFRVCMQASKRLHDTMFRGISHATMHFFNTNSSGRVLNRFSKDMGAIDEILPSAMLDCLQIALGLVGTVALVGISNPWLMIPMFILCIIFYYMRIVYLRTSRSVKRLEGITRSPVFAHFSATMQGITTIRAFDAGEILTKEFDRQQDLHSSAWYIYLASTRVFIFWLDLICALYVFVVTFSFFLVPDQSTGGNIGLAITQSIGLSGMFQWGMRQSAEVENQMTSVERVCEYSVVDQEPPLESSPENKPNATWPEEGKVVFEDLSLHYGPDEPMVLRNLNFVVEPREKIGIVGRTGAGKSSLVAALFRLAYLEGDIIIDGVKSSKLGLHDLRSKISIIPQEPFLFSGTLRRNLDPFDEYPDAALWQALEEVELKAMGLESKVVEGGGNLSVGQRQLVCLARAIVRNNPILILDEATANVDPRTDELIQETIRIKFANCTVFTIAHRLNTVMDSDKVLVMDAGRVVEFDHPHLLLQNENGTLRGMVEKTGRSMAEDLALVAKNSYQPSITSQSSKDQ